MIVEVSVHKTSALTFAAEDATNPYDNEPPDINGDGVQLYLSDERGCSAWVFVPERSSKEGRERQSEDDGEGEGDGQAGTGGAVRARMVAGWTIPREWHATWRRTGDGWAIRVQLPWPATDSSTRSFALGVVVNEKPAGRARRRGQLVLGGTEGEFVYLRGDREDRERLPQFQILT